MPAGRGVGKLACKQWTAWGSVVQTTWPTRPVTLSSSDSIPSAQAMGENLHDEVAGEAEDSRQRRLKLIAAVEGDNWSGVIEEQTAETVVSSCPCYQLFSLCCALDAARHAAGNQ